MKRIFVVTLGALGALFVLSRRYTPVRAAGGSMAPVIEPGDLLAVRPLREPEPHQRQVVIARAGDIEIVKRVVARPGSRGLAPGEFWLEGDHAERSTDSRAMGPVRRDDIRFVVRACYWPPRRARLFLNNGEFPTGKRRSGGSRGGLR